MAVDDTAPSPGLFDFPTLDDATPTKALLEAIDQYDRGECHLAWSRYVCAERVYAAVCEVDPEVDTRFLDDFALTAARLATTRRITKSASNAMLTEAFALTFRIPAVAECLRDGIISPRQFQLLVSFTDLIDGMPYAEDVDEDLAAELRRKITWTPKRLRDATDRVICRYDVDAVRRRHESAKDKRACWTKDLAYGMAQLGITASAEDIALAKATNAALADRVCANDPRTVSQRRCDAAVCRLQQVPFECHCGGSDCTADIGGQEVSERQARIVLHVVCERSTLDETDMGPVPDPPPDDDGGSDGGPDGGDPAAWQPEPTGSQDDGGTAPESLVPDDPIDPDPRTDGPQRPGFIDGYGVISPDHVREIAARPDTLIRYLNPEPDRPLPSCLPSSPYRFSTALATYIRIRDAYCAFPGCTAPAWSCEIDHITEYNHQSPVAGGQTTAGNGGAKCKFHHLVKTFGDWLDDQYTAADGYTHTTVRTPEGWTVHSHGQTNEDLFPALRSFDFQVPPALSGSAHSTSDRTRAGPQRSRTRLADKLSRRRGERKKNRQARLVAGLELPDF